MRSDAIIDELAELGVRTAGGALATGGTGITVAHRAVEAVQALNKSKGGTEPA